MKRTLFLVCAILGTLLPYVFLLPFLFENGLDINLFIQQLFQTQISSFFGMDVVLSSLALGLFVWIEGSRLKMKGLWLYGVCNLCVGVSLALPLFLYVRAGRLTTLEQTS